MWTELQERRGRSQCWQLGRVESSELVIKTKSCLNTVDQVNGRGTVAKVCQALKHTKLSERIDEAGLCRAPSCASVSFTVSMACRAR